MKKMTLALLALLILLAPCARAQADYADAFDTDAVERGLPGSAQEAVQGMSPGDADLNTGIENLLRSAKGQAGGFFKQALSSMLLILAVVILCGIASSFAGNSEYIALAGVLCVAVTAISGLNGIMADATQAVNEMNSFVQVLLPTLVGAGTAMGMPTAFFVRQTATVFFSGLLGNLISGLLFPLLYAYLALITVNAALPRDMLARLAQLVKWLLCGILSLTLIAFVTYLTVSGVVAGSADAVAVKGAKTAISGVVPVVGGIISDAAETVLVGAGVIKNALGIFGLVAVLGIVLAPFLQLGIRILVFKLTAALASTLTEERLTKYIDQLSTAFSLALAIVAASTLLVLISIVSCIQAGVG